MTSRSYLPRLFAAAFMASVLGALPVAAAPLAPSATPLANLDVVPSDLVLALSVEFPTGDTTSYLNSDPTYQPAKTYYGYFDPAKCYRYDASKLYFYPLASCPTDATKGNFLNWLTMTSLDQFRKVLTGGNRIVDTATQTVLQRSYNDAQSSLTYMPDRSAQHADAGAMGSASGTWSYRNLNLGDKLLVQSGNSVTVSNLLPADLATNSCAQLVSLYGSRNHVTSPPWTCYHVRVEVCKSTPGRPEDNCAQYGRNYKPEGLMQQYAKKMRFAAFGYLVDQSKATQGGVLRARMKPVGPTVFSNATLATTPNPAKEWDASTGVLIANPDSADASASGVGNSGVINYLNKFGYNQPASSGGYAYKGADPMAELYYEALRYIRGLRPSSQALPNSVSTAQLDGFPAIRFGGSNAANGSSTVTPTTTDDPVVSACQKIAILTIGDVNNHCDTRVPGGRTNSTCGGTLPADAVSGTANPGTEFASLTNVIAGLEGTSTQASASPGRFAGWYLGGMAYWAHINDMRPDLSSGRRASAIQNIDSYFFDVLQPYNSGPLQDGTKSPGPTPMYLAAKYGGFDLTKTDQSSSATKTNPNTFLSGSTVKSWDTNNDNKPDAWFGGNDPLKMKAGLTQVFDSIAAAGTSGGGGAPAASSVSLVDVRYSYYATYTLENGGRGTLVACPWGASCATPVWSSDDWLTPGRTHFQSDTDRAIITRSGSAGVAFKYNSLSGGDQTNLAFDPVTQQSDSVGTARKRVQYLRGDATHEIRNAGNSGSSGIFRSRLGTLLGDIVDSGPVYVGSPTSLYSGSKFSGYDAFRASNRNRQAMVYVGANDGMLHGFNADTGKEVFAYLPGYFLQPDSGKSAARISALTDPEYQHNFFVDATPMVGDVQVGGAWKTMLVGGLGAGGKGFYALDITSPANLTEGNAASISLWETTDTDIGYTYNQPTQSQISGQALQFALVPTSGTSYTWRIIVGNGFGSTSGNAYLLMLDPANGGITKIATGTGIADNGLATPFPMDTDGDGLVDTIWAGDIKGNMWRFRWNGSSWVSTKIFSTGGQPITSAPAVTRHNNGSNKFMVVFGTGKYIEAGDYQDGSQQSIYGIVDDVSGTNTVSKTSLVRQTVTGNSSERSYSSNTSTTATGGWYIDLPLAKERVISNPVIPADTGVVLVGSFTPATACMDITGYVNPLNVYTGGQAQDYSGQNNTLVNLYGYSQTGIPNMGVGASNSNRVTILTGRDREKDYKVDIWKLLNKGLRGSWRQIQ